MKKLYTVLLFFLLIIVVIYGYNFFTLQTPINNLISNDSRNHGVRVSVHYKSFIFPRILVFDVKNISSDIAPVDVFRVLLQSAETLKNNNFEKVELASKGKTKFFIKGEYFSNLGSEYGTQNPVYTTRTFPENLYLTTGEVAYDHWEGGLIGVVSKQMEDFTDAYTKWFVDDYRK